MSITSQPDKRIAHGPPAGKLQGNAGELGGAGVATSNPAPAGGLSHVWHCPRPSTTPNQQVGPPSSPPPTGGPGGGSATATPVAVHYLDPLAKDATHSLDASSLKPHSIESQQFAFSDFCPGWATVGTCPNGHRYAKELVCGREWCPTCGQKHSIAHQRRVARWMPKMRQLRSIGYLVITFPPEVRWQLENKPHIRYVYNKVIEVLAGKRRGRLPRAGGFFARGVARWHWYGDEPAKWHPHLNVLVDAGYIDRAELRLLKRRLAHALHVKRLVVNYHYSPEVPKKVHMVEYVTRATFTDHSWSPDVADIALYNFRNARYWGKWDGDPVWEQPEASAEYLPAVAALEDGECPECGEHVEWTKARNLIHVFLFKDTEPLGAGYHRIKDRSPPI